MGIDWSRVVSIEDLRRLAERHVPRPIFGFIDGGAEDEVGLAENRAAFDRLKFRHRVFVDVASIDTSAELLGVPSIENLADWGGDLAGQTLAAMIAAQFDPSVTWDDLKRFRDAWPGKLVLKGILTPEDAERAVAVGADGIVVSNHGGRQLDCTLAPVDALPDVVRATAGRLTVLMDGGVRRGSHIAKACALGASGVLVGRATLYGVAGAGEQGARHALTILTDELKRAMALLGCPSVSALDARCMQRA